MNANGQVLARVYRRDITGDLEIALFTAQLGNWWFSGFCRRFDLDINFVVIDRKGAWFRPEVPLKIGPQPTIAERFSAKITFITNNITVHMAHAALVKSVSQLRERGGFFFFWP